MGVDVNAHSSVPLLVQDALSGTIDAVLHVGDLAYDLDTPTGLNDGTVNGDVFMVMTQNYSAYVPTHFTVGALVMLRRMSHADVKWPPLLHP